MAFFQDSIDHGQHALVVQRASVAAAFGNTLEADQPRIGGGVERHHVTSGKLYHTMSVACETNTEKDFPVFAAAFFASSRTSSAESVPVEWYSAGGRGYHLSFDPLITR